MYNPPQGHQGLYKILDECFHDAYDSNVVITDYGQVIEEGKISDRDLVRPTEEWVAALSEKQILAAIALHFRREGLVEGLPFNLNFIVHNKRAQIKCLH